MGDIVIVVVAFLFIVGVMAFFVLVAYTALYIVAVLLQKYLGLFPNVKLMRSNEEMERIREAEKIEADKREESH